MLTGGSVMFARLPVPSFFCSQFFLSEGRGICRFAGPAYSLQPLCSVGSIDWNARKQALRARVSRVYCFGDVVKLAAEGLKLGETRFNLPTNSAEDPTTSART